MTELRTVLLGPPGSGKTTQAVRLSEECGIKHIETGRILRGNKDAETEFGKPRDYIDNGQLVPHQIVNEIVHRLISEHDGYVLDGYPRTLSQAKFLDKHSELDVVIYLDMSDEVLVERLVNRRVCEDCGSVYNINTDTPTTRGICDNCSGKLLYRKDDDERIIQDRIHIYEDNVRPLVEFYEARGILVNIDGEKTQDSVRAEVMATVDRFS